MSIWAILGIIFVLLGSHTTVFLVGGRIKKLRFERDGEREVNDALARTIEEKDEARQRVERLRATIVKLRDGTKLRDEHEKDKDSKTRTTKMSSKSRRKDQR